MKEHKLMRQEQAAVEGKKLSTEEACKMCDVCTTTLWAWDKAGYLRAAKAGRRKRYTFSDIKRLLSPRLRTIEEKYVHLRDFSRLDDHTSQRADYIEWIYSDEDEHRQEIDEL